MNETTVSLDFYSIISQFVVLILNQSVTVFTGVARDAWIHLSIDKHILFLDVLCHQYQSYNYPVSIGCSRFAILFRLWWYKQKTMVFWFWHQYHRESQILPRFVCKKKGNPFYNWVSMLPYKRLLSQPMTGSSLRCPTKPVTIILYENGSCELLTLVSMVRTLFRAQILKPRQDLILYIRVQ